MLLCFATLVAVEVVGHIAVEEDVDQARLGHLVHPVHPVHPVRLGNPADPVHTAAVAVHQVDLVLQDSLAEVVEVVPIRKSSVNDQSAPK